MFEIFMSSLNDWNAAKNERQKLQHAYLVLAVVIVLVAGIVSLCNANLGHEVVLFALISIGAYFANAIVWNLIQSALVQKLATKPKRK